MGVDSTERCFEEAGRFEGIAILQMFGLLIRMLGIIDDTTAYMAGITTIHDVEQKLFAHQAMLPLILGCHYLDQLLYTMNCFTSNRYHYQLVIAPFTLSLWVVHGCPNNQ